MAPCRGVHGPEPRKGREGPSARGAGGTHDSEGLGLGEQLLGEQLDVLDGHRVDPRDHLVDAGQLVVQQLGLGDPGHPRARLLHAQHEAAAELALAALELLRGDATLGEQLFEEGGFEDGPDGGPLFEARGLEDPAVDKRARTIRADRRFRRR